jgi:4-hydroxy-3-polyprenylbenzoate decarboxylase
MPRKIAFGITGASGVIYARRLLQRLLDEECRIALCVSRPATIVWNQELGDEFPLESPDWNDVIGRDPGELLTLYDEKDVGAPPATGSAGFDGYVVCPCTAGSLGRIAAGYAENLITRMSDVALKERRTLVLVPRETPYSSIHLRNMLTLTEAGAVILPASPGFYMNPESVDDLVDFVVDRIVSHLLR